MQRRRYLCLLGRRYPAPPTCACSTPWLPPTTSPAMGLCALSSPCGHCRRLAFALPRCLAHASTFLSPFPRYGFASRTFSRFPRNGTMETLTPARLTCRAGLPAYLATPSCRSVSTHVSRLVVASHHASVTSDFRASPWNRRLAAALRRIEFVHLRTNSSPPVALHVASGRRSYLRLRSCGKLRHGLSPC